MILPEWIDIEAWQGFVEMRKKEKHPMTGRAEYLAIKQLEKYRQAGMDPNAILDQSTMHGWRGLFPVKEYYEQDTRKSFEAIREQASKAAARRVLERIGSTAEAGSGIPEGTERASTNGLFGAIKRYSH
jgi:hypothetical protein